MRDPKVVLTLALTSYAVGVGAVLTLSSDPTVQQTAAVVLTGAVVIWYTWETMLLRRVAVTQREASVRPFVLFKGSVEGYFVENVGASPALGVKIEPITFKAEGLELLIDFPTPVPIVRPGETTSIDTKVIVNGRQVETVFAAHLDPKYAVVEVEVAITFRSIEGRTYRLLQATAPGTMTIAGFTDATDA